MHGSDEEVDDPPEVDSDEDYSDDGDEHVHEEVRVFVSKSVNFPLILRENI